MRTFYLALAASAVLASCTPLDPPTARNPNGTLELACSGNYVCNKATGSYSRFSSDPRCFSARSGERNPGCFFDAGGTASSDGSAAAAAAGAGAGGSK